MADAVRLEATRADVAGCSCVSVPCDGHSTGAFRSLICGVDEVRMCRMGAARSISLGATRGLAGPSGVC